MKRLIIATLLSGALAGCDSEFKIESPVTIHRNFELSDSQGHRVAFQPATFPVQLGYDRNYGGANNFVSFVTGDGRKFAFYGAKFTDAGRVQSIEALAKKSRQTTATGERVGASVVATVICNPNCTRTEVTRETIGCQATNSNQCGGGIPGPTDPSPPCIPDSMPGHQEAEVIKTYADATVEFSLRTESGETLASGSTSHTFVQRKVKRRGACIAD